MKIITNLMRSGLEVVFLRNEDETLRPDEIILLIRGDGLSSTSGGVDATDPTELTLLEREFQKQELHRYAGVVLGLG